MTDKITRKDLLSDQHYSPVFVEYSLMKEFVCLQQRCVANLYVVPSHSSPFRWFAVLFVNEGVYRGAIIRCRVEVPLEYPNCQCPRVFFDPIVFHPLVNPRTGELNTNYRFADWSSTETRLLELFLFVKNMFYNLKDTLKEEWIRTDSVGLCDMYYAQNYRLFNDNLSEFKVKAKETVAECHSKLYNDRSCMFADDRNALQFGPWNPEIHEELRKKLISGQNVAEELMSTDENHKSSAGLSWVQKGSLQMFSKDN